MFDRSKITKVYSGRKGCACGCRGKYAYASAFRCERPDYYSGDEGVSDRSVRTITNRVAQLLADPASDVARVTVDPAFIAVDMTHDRTYTIYFK